MIKQAEIERRLLVVLDQVGGSLPAEQAADMRELAHAGEPGIALENLCEQLFEFDVVVPRAAVDELALLGGTMGLDPDLWEQL